MNKTKAIPENFMTVGELAKKMGTTVRTLQYYDKEGVLSFLHWLRSCFMQLFRQIFRYIL